MSEQERRDGQIEAASSNKADADPESVRRDFIKRFGSYAAGTCAGLFVLMSPKTSTHAGSDGGPFGPRR